MLRMFHLVMRLYPAAFRAEFEDEMRSVFLALVEDGRPAWSELFELLRGAAYERSRLFAPLAAGAVFAFGSQLLLYRALLTPGLIVCLLAAVVSGQPLPKQDQAALDEARGIYQRAFTALRNARTMDDMRKLSDALDSADWISVDRFGRPLLTRAQADREFESLLALPPDRRVSAMDIIWAERDSTRMIVAAWMSPSEEVRDGHRLTRATLIRDIFENTPNGWRRIRHDKLLPNGTQLAVDGKQLAEGNRVTPLK